MSHGAATSDDKSDEQSTASVNAEAVLNFVCKLTQTVLKKSDLSLVIVDDKAERRQQLDTKLWSFDPVSFVPHTLLDDRENPQPLSAPVTLTSHFPTGFDGVVLNLAAAPLPLNDSSDRPDRILEIITPDDISKQQGRDKYRFYRDLGYELIHYPIN